MEIYQKFLLLLTTIEPPATHCKRKRYDRLVETISGFLTVCHGDKLAASLFHLAICISNTDLQGAPMELINRTQGESTTEGAATEQKKPPARGICKAL